MQRIKFIIVSALGLALLAGLTGTGTAGLPYSRDLDDLRH